MSARLAARQARSALLECQRRVLEHIANGTPLEEILATLVALVEEQIPGLRCALLLADAQQKTLYFVPAPHVPEGFKRDVARYLVIADQQCPCAAAAFLREPAYARDIATDPRWSGFGAIAVRYGLRAIWSTPILGDDNTVLGTFAMYYGEPRLPDAEHIELIDMATQLARVAIERRRAEAALRESETRFRQIAENVREVFWMSTPRLDEVLYVSPAYERLWGRSVQSLRENPRSFLEPIVAEDRDRVLAAIQTDRESGFDVTYRIVRPDGTARWVRDRGFPVKNDAGEVYRIVGVAEDVTERQQAEERMRALSQQSEEHLRLVINTIPTTAWSLTADGAVDFINQRYLEYTGLTLEQALADPRSHVHPDDLPVVMERWSVDRAAGRRSEMEMRLRSRTGEYRWFLVRTVPLRDEHGNIVKWYGSSIDIEARKRAEAAVRENEQLLKFVLETLPISVVVVNRAGDIVLVNAATRRVWAGEIIVSGAERRTRVKGFWHSSGKRLSPGEWASAVAVSEGREVVNELIDTEAFDGRRKTIENSAAPIRNADGAIIGAVVVNHEVTDRVRAEEALRESAQRLQHLSRRLLALQEEERRNLSRELHDRLGETLTALSINLAILKERAQGDPGATARIDDSAELVKSTAAAIENIIGELRPPMLDDHGLAAALEWYGRLFTQRGGVAVSVQGADTNGRLAPQVEIALFRIAQEALNNVAKHAAAKHVAITLARARSELVMSIADDGIGFQPAASASGRGLGLVTMRERAQAVGGTFKIEPLPDGAGTRLTVRVPV